MIVDNYGLSEKWENMIKPHVEKLVVIDDLVKRSHNCDLIVDQNVHTKRNGSYDKLVPNNCIQLLGPKYAMVRDQFVNLRKISKIRTFPIKRILSPLADTSLIFSSAASSLTTVCAKSIMWTPLRSPKIKGRI